METLLGNINKLVKELHTLQPIKPEYQRKLDEKFRLEFNFNSNHLEGNTLTYGQTKLLLIFDKTTGDHDMREYEEMKAHDVALKMIKDLAKDEEHPLTENFIRQLNEIILVRTFWKEAITPDGQTTRREITPGKYKEYPNSVRLANGEIYNYPTPEQVPALMSDLMKYYQEEITKEDMNPVVLAAMMHYKLVCIHPFDDGNGRVARLLMNYVLLKYNYPPIIIKTEKKKEYLTALNKADVGDIDSLIKFIAEQIIYSLELSIKAAKGDEIE